MAPASWRRIPRLFRARVVPAAARSAVRLPFNGSLETKGNFTTKNMPVEGKTSRPTNVRARPDGTRAEWVRRRMGAPWPAESPGEPALLRLVRHRSGTSDKSMAKACSASPSPVTVLGRGQRPPTRSGRTRGEALRPCFPGPIGEREIPLSVRVRPNSDWVGGRAQGPLGAVLGRAAAQDGNPLGRPLTERVARLDRGRDPGNRSMKTGPAPARTVRPAPSDVPQAWVTVPQASPPAPQAVLNGGNPFRHAVEAWSPVPQALVSVPLASVGPPRGPQILSTLTR